MHDNLYGLYILFKGKVSSHDSFEGRFELLIRGGVTEWVDGAVGVAEEVGEHVDVNVDAGGTEAGDDGEDVVRRPTSDECP